MKKLVSLKSILMSILMVTIIGVTTTVMATDTTTIGSEDSSVFTSNDTAATASTEPVTVTPSDYNTASSIPEDPNYSTTTTTTTTTTTEDNTTTSTGITSDPVYNTVDEEEDADKDDLPQTGIEDYHIGALLIACVVASIYMYRKMKEYKNI